MFLEMLSRIDDSGITLGFIFILDSDTDLHEIIRRNLSPAWQWDISDIREGSELNNFI